jgi:hypothetical protein
MVTRRAGMRSDTKGGRHVFASRPGPTSPRRGGLADPSSWPAGPLRRPGTRPPTRPPSAVSLRLRHPRTDGAPAGPGETPAARRGDHRPGRDARGGRHRRRPCTKTARRRSGAGKAPIGRRDIACPAVPIPVLWIDGHPPWVRATSVRWPFRPRKPRRPPQLAPASSFRFCTSAAVQPRRRAIRVGSHDHGRPGSWSAEGPPTAPSAFRPSGPLPALAPGHEGRANSRVASCWPRLGPRIHAVASAARRRARRARWSMPSRRGRRQRLGHTRPQPREERQAGPEATVTTGSRSVAEVETAAPSSPSSPRPRGCGRRSQAPWGGRPKAAAASLASIWPRRPPGFEHAGRNADVRHQSPRSGHTSGRTAALARSEADGEAGPHRGHAAGRN